MHQKILTKNIPLYAMLSKRLWLATQSCLLFIMLLLSPSAVFADVGIGLGVGTTGISGNLTFPIYSDKLNIRGTINGFSYDTDINETDIEYDAEVDLESYGLLLDWHPFGGGFRLSTGFYSNKNKITGDATPQDTVEIGGTTFEPEEIGTLQLDAGYGRSFAPYAGIGWGNAISKDQRLSFSIDLGIMFTGDINVDLTANSPLADALPSVKVSLEDALKQEEQDLEDDLAVADFWPVLNLGVSYRF